MSAKSWQRLLSFVLLAGLLSSMIQPSRAKAFPSADLENRDSFSNQPANSKQRTISDLHPEVRYPVYSGISPALNSLGPVLLPAAKAQPPRQIPLRPLPHRQGEQTKIPRNLRGDSMVQRQPGQVNMPSTDFNFDGLTNNDNQAQVGFFVAPPDTTGAVGYDPESGKKYYVQWVNLVFAIWDVSSNPPTQVVGATPGNALWSGSGTKCETHNDGDVIVLFDEAANRWLMSQFALDFDTPEFHQCIAISTSADPTGSWYLYDYLISTSKMNDYPKFGVWPDAYYMAVNQFTAFGWGGQGAVAFERDKMLVGDAGARMVYFDLPDNPGGMLPADIDGLTPPPAGAPNYFVQVEDDAWGAPADRLRIWEFHVDWGNPSNSTFVEAGQLPTAPFDSQICPEFYTCIDQPNGQRLDAIPDRLMYRLQYRNLGSYQAMVVNHTVNGGLDLAGVRWYELRNSGSGWNIYQQGTFAPDDGEHRWMGSIAMDQSGNIALGYSVSSSNTYPSIRYVGRLVGDPPNTMTQDEVEMATGSYSQEGVYRWGDYSTMALDPTDDCTFWYTQEYIVGPNEIGWGNWSTRIASFRFPTCTSGPKGDLQGTITDANTGNPIAGARVDLGGGIMTVSDENGFYQILGLPAGDYTVNVLAYGYLPTSANVTIINGEVTTQDFALQPAPPSQISGVVSDGSGHGWPLYARIDISTLGFKTTLFTNPATGAYSITLFEGFPYTFKVNAVSSGYNSETRLVTPPPTSGVEDFSLTVNAIACIAPGYALETVYSQNFDSDDGGFSVSGSNASWEWGTPSSGPARAHSGSNVWATNLSGNYNDNENSEITSPDIDLSAYAGQQIMLSWWQWLRTEDGFDYASVQISNDGGLTWNTYFGPVSGSVDTEWTQHTVFLDPTYAVGNFRVRFHLETDSSVTLPGFYVDDIAIVVLPSPPSLYTEDFENDDGGFTTSGFTSWEWGVPTRGPGSAHSGTNAWGTNLDGNYEVNEDGYLASPVIDLSAASGSPQIQLSWWQWFQSEWGYDFGTIEVSANGGISWTLVYSMTGIWDTQWSKYSINLDPSIYAVPEFRLRFGLSSDETVTYPGFYVDDIAIQLPPSEPPTPPCNPLPGGMVVGNVYDANTGYGINGAIVTGDSGDSTVSFATPLDLLVQDGLYLLFSPVGDHTLTASKSGGYGADSRGVTIVSNGVTQQDFSLPAGWLSPVPAQISATLDMSATATAFFTLTNNGGLDASFRLTERKIGMTPARPGAPVYRQGGHFSPYHARDGSKGPLSINKHIPRPDVPPWTDIASYPIPIMDNAAAELDGKVYSVGGTDGFNSLNSGYVYDPLSDSWSPIANMARARAKPAVAFVNDLLYVVGGWDTMGNLVATLEIYDPATDTWSSGAPIPLPAAAAAGVSLDGQFYVIGGCPTGFSCGLTNVFRYDPTTDTWSSLAPYPEPTSWLACGAISGMIYCAGGVSDAGESDNTFVYNPASDTWTQLADMPQTQWAMGYTAANGLLYISGGVTDNFSTITNETFFYDPASDTWTPDANSNNVVYRGGSACGFYKIGGSIGGFNPIPNAEVYPGLTECGEAVDVPWLSENPVTGTLKAGGDFTVIEVTFDTRVPEINQPGLYTALLKAKEDTPYASPEVSVAMNVLPPATWGKVTGSITGLGYCDAAGNPLPNATVEISGIATTRSNASGLYTYWLEQGDYTLIVSAPGYVSQVLDVTVSAGETSTHDFALRLDAPCASHAPQAFQVSVWQGYSLTETLTITNAGAAGWTFNILESALDLTPAPSLKPIGGGRAPTFSTPAAIGPASVRSLKGTSAGRPPKAPDSAWFAALDLPNGAVRYAHAQCYEQPDSFYVISGVDSNFNLSTKAWRYDALENEWIELAPIPVGSEGPAAVCYLGKIYVMGGNGSNQFYIYDIAKDTWSSGSPLPRPVWGAVAAAWRGKIYLIGGDSDFFFGGTSGEVNIYDIASDTWSKGSDMPFPAVVPGYFQVGPWVYMAGGWGDLAPAENITATQRYDLEHDAWELGPQFTSARADFALAATSQALYAIGGDRDGGGPFDAVKTVERLDLTTWPAGAWSEDVDPLPVALTSNNAGFCAQTLFSSAVWSVGGFSPAGFGTITGGNRFLRVSGESCYSIYSDVPWLSETPQAGEVASDSQDQINLEFDASGLDVGRYTATLVIPGNDPNRYIFVLPVTIDVVPVYKTYMPVILLHGVVD